MPTRSAWLWLRWSSSVRTRRKKSRRLKRTNRPSSEDWIVDAGLGDRANPCSGHHRCGTAPESHRTSLRSTSHQLPPMRPPGYSTRAQTVKTPRGSPRRRNPGVDARVALPPRQTCFPIPVIGSDANSQTPCAGKAGLSLGLATHLPCADCGTLASAQEQASRQDPPARSQRTTRRSADAVAARYCFRRRAIAAAEQPSAPASDEQRKRAARRQERGRCVCAAWAARRLGHSLPGLHTSSALPE